MGLWKHVGKGISVFVLVSILQFPSVIRFSHHCEAHEHYTFMLDVDDFHEAGHDCSICHFQLASFTYDIPVFPELLSRTYPETAEKHFFCTAINCFTLTNARLRAPPLFSL